MASSHRGRPPKHGADAGEALAAICLADASGVINVGGPHAPKLRDTIETFAANLSQPADLRFGAVPYSPNQVTHLEPALARLHSLGWTAKTPDSVGLAATAQWIQGGSLSDPMLPGKLLPAHPSAR
jgi:nucleoside-diphosphate-sugar epimerase